MGKTAQEKGGDGRVKSCHLKHGEKETAEAEGRTERDGVFAVAMGWRGSGELQVKGTANAKGRGFCATSRTREKERREKRRAGREGEGKEPWVRSQWSQTVWDSVGSLEGGIWSNQPRPLLKEFCSLWWEAEKLDGG